MPVRARRVAASTAAVVLGISLSALAAPASAESRNLKDGRGDTWDYSQTEPEKKPGNPEADLRKVVIRHSDRTVVITARMQNLRKVGNGVGLTMNIDTPSDVTYNASVFGQPDAWKGQSQLYASEGAACATKEKMNYRNDVVSMTIPRSCLGRPDWVRLEVYGIFVKGNDTVVYDNAHNGKADGTLTRRIERG